MSESDSYSSKRLAKNTLILYVRMVFMMLLSLYTSRVVLKVLGVEDYGIYDVVGGFVSMFSILSSSLSTAISRFITFELGRGESGKVNVVFSSAVIIQFCMAIVMAIIMGSVGSWYLFNKMNIPDGRLNAAFWVMICSIFGFGIGLVSTPYNAAIIAHERMDAFAYISILDAILKLAIVFLLPVIPIDKLVSYSLFLLLVALIIRSAYAIYCKRHFPECHLTRSFDKTIFKEIGCFAGWSFFGEASWVLNTQGVNLLINYYFGVTLNAARGIAGQVNSAVYRFAGNFMTALDPQITKSYASGEHEATRSIVCRGARLSFFLMLFFAIPICLETPILLRIWLTVVPDHTIPFTRLSIVSSMFLILSTPLVKAQYATGRIKRYQIINTLCSLWVFPLTWLAFHCGLSAEWSYYIFAVFYFLIIFVRLFLVAKMIKMPAKVFLTDVLARCLVTSVAAAILPTLLVLSQPESVLRFLETGLLSVISTCTAVYFLGLRQEEKDALLRICRERIAQWRQSSKK